MISGALQVAVNEINANPNLLPNHRLNYIFDNTCGKERQSECSSFMVVLCPVSVEEY